MPIQNEQPNLYNLQGDGVTITYTPAGIGGTPSLQYQEGDQNRSFQRDEVRITDSELGTLVSVTLKIVPDFNTVMLNLLIPLVNLPQGDAQPIRTIAIVREQAGGIVGPRLVRGQVQTYRTVTLKGTASLVEF